MAVIACEVDSEVSGDEKLEKNQRLNDRTRQFPDGLRDPEQSEADFSQASLCRSDR